MSKSMIEKILDPEDNDPITLFSETGEMMEFEQIALICLDEGLYLLAQPIGEVEGIGPNDGLVFALWQDDSGEWCLEVEEDDDIVEQVFRQ